jgi:hypothetical protein
MWRDGRRCILPLGTTISVLSKILRQAGTGVSTCDYEGWHPVHCAAFHRSVDVIRVLEKVGANPSGGTFDGEEANNAG